MLERGDTYRERAQEMLAQARQNERRRGYFLDMAMAYLRLAEKVSAQVTAPQVGPDQHTPQHPGREP
jgi:hypothetical protein